MIILLKGFLNVFMQDENINNDDGYMDIIRKKIMALREWVKPDPADPLYLTILKSIYKGIALLILIALSPVIFILLVIIFFATL